LRDDGGRNGDEEGTKLRLPGQLESIVLFTTYLFHCVLIHFFIFVPPLFRRTPRVLEKTLETKNARLATAFARATLRDARARDARGVF